MKILSFTLSIYLITTAALGSEKQPNIILLLADDMGWAQTGYYDYPLLKTPNLDSMASEGLRMDRFYAGAPSCTPTRASILTGRTNDRTGAFRVGHSINRQELTLAAAFKDAGYATAHFGKWHLNEAVAKDHPLPLHDPHNPGEFGFDYWLSATSGFDFSEFELSRNGQRESFRGDGSEVIVAEALKYITNQVKNGSPFFVVIWYSSPHGPWHAAGSDVGLFLTKIDDTSANMLGEIVAIDRSLGYLRMALRDLDISENTLVWFTSDNGGTPNIDALIVKEGDQRQILYPSNCGNEIDPSLTSLEAIEQHGCYRGVHPDSTGDLRGFKKDFYEGGLRVPAVIEWPDKINPRISNFPASTTDIFPTLIDIAGLDPESINQVYDGISIIHAFREEPEKRHKPIGFRANGGWAWLDNDWKILKNYDQADSSFELYNVTKDPSEVVNLVESYPKIAKHLYQQFQAWNLSVTRSALGADYPERKVLPSGRAPNTLVDSRRETQFQKWHDELKAFETKTSSMDD